MGPVLVVTAICLLPGVAQTENNTQENDISTVADPNVTLPYDVTIVSAYNRTENDSNTQNTTLPIPDHSVPVRSNQTEVTPALSNVTDVSSVTAKPTSNTTGVSATTPVDKGCVPGTMFVQESCLPCPVGFYQSQFNQTSCIVCPYGKTTKYLRTRNQDGGCVRKQILPDYVSSNGSITFEQHWKADLRNKKSSAYLVMTSELTELITQIFTRKWGFQRCRDFEYSEGSVISSFWLDFSSDSNVMARNISDTIVQAAKAGGNDTLLGTILIDSVVADIVERPQNSPNSGSQNDKIIIAVGAFLGLVILIVMVLALLYVAKKTDLIRKISSRVSPESNLEMEKKRQMSRKKKKKEEQDKEARDREGDMGDGFTPDNVMYPEEEESTGDLSPRKQGQTKLEHEDDKK